MYRNINLLDSQCICIHRAVIGDAAPDINGGNGQRFIMLYLLTTYVIFKILKQNIKIYLHKNV